MKINEVEEPLEFKDMMQEYCQPFLKEIGDSLTTSILYRGINGDVGLNFKGYSIKPVRQDRKPMHTSNWMHGVLVSAFDESGFKANRDNSIFCTGDESFASQFGTVYAVIPIGNYDYTWSPIVQDLYGVLPNHINVNKNFLSVEFKTQTLFSFEFFIRNLRLYFVGFSNPDNKYQNRLPEKLSNEYVEYLKNNETTKVIDAGIEFLLKAFERYNIRTVADFMRVFCENDFEFLQIVLKNSHVISSMLSMSKSINIERYIDLNSITKFISSNYSNKDLIKAINTGTEIMLQCESYFVVNPQMLKYFKGF